MDAGIAGLTGALGGAVIGGGITYVVQARERRDRDRTRWHEARLEAYAAFLTALDGWNRRMHDVDQYGWDGDPEALEQVPGSVLTTYNRVELLASPLVKKAAEATLPLGSNVMSSGKPSGHRWQLFTDAKDEFLRCAQAEVGIRRRGPWWRRAVRRSPDE